MAGFNKCNKAESQRRITEVYKLLMKSWSRRDILIYITENYKVGKDDAQYILNETYKVIKEDVEQDRKQILEKTIQQLDAIAKKAEEQGDLKLKVETMKERNKILGLYSPEKVQNEIVIKYVEGDEDL